MARTSKRTAGQRSSARRENESTVGLNEMSDSVAEFADDMQSRVGDLRRNVQSRLRDLDIDEATIPDAFENVPKMISPRVHSMLDAAVTAYFIGLCGYCISRGNTRGAIAAGVNAAMVGGMSLMTDYEGTGEKPINFKLHGTLDAVQAGIAALAPTLHGFADEPEAMFFYGQAANEVAVLALTDWDAGMPRSRRGRRAA